MKKLFALYLSIVTYVSHSQDSLLQYLDTASLNMEAVYNRPFLSAGKLPISIGGYVEANARYVNEDGLSEGLSFQLPRLTIFMASSIQQRIKFLSEIELEEGGREINIEFASLDVTFHPLVNFRGGVVMNPIGAFNQNHDGPKWEFVERPIASTTIIPSTWSNVGFGLYGKYAKGRFIWAYEAYLTNGFDESIILNQENRTWLPSSKNSSERFDESFNGHPLASLKVAVLRRGIGEIGLSWMGGYYNLNETDGFVLDKKRSVHLLAVDWNTVLPTRTSVKGEWVIASIDVPQTYTQQFGNRQTGGYVDLVQPVLTRSLLGWEKSTLSLALRVDYADYNAGSFRETGGEIGDELLGIAPAITFRPSGQTVFRLNYQHLWVKDLLNNPSARQAALLFGLASYF